MAVTQKEVIEVACCMIGQSVKERCPFKDDGFCHYHRTELSTELWKVCTVETVIIFHSKHKES